MASVLHLNGGKLSKDESCRDRNDISRCNHLTKVKGKLEQSLDEVEDSLEREKKAKGDVEVTSNFAMKKYCVVHD